MPTGSSSGTKLMASVVCLGSLGYGYCSLLLLLNLDYALDETNKAATGERSTAHVICSCRFCAT